MAVWSSAIIHCRRLLAGEANGDVGVFVSAVGSVAEADAAADIDRQAPFDFIHQRHDGKIAGDFAQCRGWYRGCTARCHE